MSKEFGPAGEFWDTVYPRNKPRKGQAKALIRKFDLLARRNPTKTLWSEFYASSSIGAYVHSHFSEYRLKQQEQYCCYCKEKIYSKVNANIEHVFPASVYPQFTFKFHNLAVSCRPCNSFKTDDDWFQVPKNERIYLKHQNTWQGFHPNFDDYNEHIRLFGIQTNRIHVRAYFGKTEKGQKLCDEHLYRLTTYSIRGKANPKVVEALEKLSGYIVRVKKATPASQALLQKFAKFLYLP